MNIDPNLLPAISGNATSATLAPLSAESEERPCEVCGDPVASGERWEVLREDGPVWRHPWHTEPVDKDKLGQVT